MNLYVRTIRNPKDGTEKYRFSGNAASAREFVDSEEYRAYWDQVHLALYVFYEWALEENGKVLDDWTFVPAEKFPHLRPPKPASKEEMLEAAMIDPAVL